MGYTAGDFTFPGTGKFMLAKRLPNIFLLLTLAAALETAKIPRLN